MVNYLSCVESTTKAIIHKEDEKKKKEKRNTVQKKGSIDGTSMVRRRWQSNPQASLLFLTCLDIDVLNRNLVIDREITVQSSKLFNGRNRHGRYCHFDRFLYTFIILWLFLEYKFTLI